MVRLTWITTDSPVVGLVSVTLPVYVPIASPAGFAVMPTLRGACVVTVPDAGFTFSHLPPPFVWTLAENWKDPVPALDTRTCWVNDAVGLLGNVNETEFRSMFSFGAVAGATCTVTAMLVAVGTPRAVVTVMVAWCGPGVRLAGSTRMCTNWGVRPAGAPMLSQSAPLLLVTVKARPATALVTVSF